jgi:hypothetical protein
MTREEYTKFLNDLLVERPRCKCCGGDIYYTSSIAKLSKAGKSKGSVIYEGKNHNTIKKVGDTEYHLQVCQDCLLKKYPDIKNLARTFNVMSEQTMFAFNIPQDVFEQSRQKYAMTKEHMIEKYGEGAGLEKWNKYCKRQAETNTYEYKRKKYGMSKSDFRKYNASRSSTLDNFIKRYGEEIGTQKWDEYCKRQSYTKSKEYIIKTHGEAEYERIQKDRIKGSIKSIRNQYRNDYSAISQKFFNELDTLLNGKYETYYKTKNEEYCISAQYNFYFIDYYIKDLKIAIEFNGDYWHANPKSYDKNFTIKQCNITAEEIWERDSSRYKVLEEEFGIKTYVIWESEYYNGLTAENFIKRIPELQYIYKELKN